MASARVVFGTVVVLIFCDPRILPGSSLPVSSSIPLFYLNFAILCDIGISLSFLKRFSSVLYQLLIEVNSWLFFLSLNVQSRLLSSLPLKSKGVCSIERPIVNGLLLSYDCLQSLPLSFIGRDSTLSWRVLPGMNTGQLLLSF